MSEVTKVIVCPVRQNSVALMQTAGLSIRSLPLKLLVRLVGHKTENIYRRYAIVARQELVDGLKLLADYRAGLDKTAAAPKIVSIANAIS
jgi:hypothetical protein